MKALLSCLSHYRREAILGPLFKLLEAGFDLCVPLVVAVIIDRGIGEGDAGAVGWACAMLVGLALVGLLAAVTAQYFAARAAVGTATRLRQQLFDRITHLSFGQIGQVGTSTLITRMTSDVNQVQTGVNLFLRLFLRSPLIVFGAMIMAFVIDVPSAVIFAVIIGALCAVVFGIMLSSIPMQRRVQGRLDAVTLATRENLTGARVLRAFCREEEQIETFEEKNKVLLKAQQLVGRVTGLLNPVTYVLINAALIALLYTGAVRIEVGGLTQGQVVALYNYLSQILVELVKLANLIITLTRAAACMKRVEAVLELSDETPALPEGVQSVLEDGGAVAFRNVSFRYPGAAEDTLSNISFTVYPGQTVGIIGGTGSGKSTLVHLISRFYTATEGQVYLNGEDVRGLEGKDICQTVSVVMQKPVLFAGTLGENLRFGAPNATDEEVWEALAAAQGKEVAEGKGGLDAEVEERGRNFSGGQRQRLSVARALVTKPQILILDDASSALDYATDARLRHAIRELPYHPTVFTVSQRASSLRFADVILVLEDGCLVGVGTHDELLTSCDVYREIAASQDRREAE